MSAHRSYRALIAVLALVGMLASSTVTVWAMACESCRTMANMPCCADDSAATTDTADEGGPLTARISSIGCCSGHSTACATAVHFNPGHAQSAHEFASHAYAVEQPVSKSVVPPTPVGCPAAPQLAAVSPPAPSTVVLLL
ncbi:MAG: hypothetical protein MJE77_43955 [Proteobacteria bacterium]|nr:hypothetical protein [Pseudomonadota bacterium]